MQAERVGRTDFFKRNRRVATVAELKPEGTDAPQSMVW